MKSPTEFAHHREGLKVGHGFRRALSGLLLALVIPLFSHAQYLDPETTWFAGEATFQDQGMVNEPGRMTMATPHKEAKFNTMIARFLQILDAEKTAELTTINSALSKPGKKIVIPGKDTFIADMEPVCVEWNMSPLRYYEQAGNWAPVFRAAAESELVPYVNPAAERSGMGHMHVGGPKVALNPFLKHPLLLRNMMVYLHQHPSLMWGFAEAYDIGPNSNIETLHSPYRQVRFARAVELFDRWYDVATPEQRADGAFKFLGYLWRQGGEDFFYHYRLLNLEHLKPLIDRSMGESGELRGKYTVEFRNIRPYKTPDHVQAVSEFLFQLMDRLAKPNSRIPFRKISPEQYTNFHSGLVISHDWREVQNELRLKRKNPIWDEMVGEYIANLSSHTFSLDLGRGVRVAPAYSEKENKGTYFEISLPRIEGETSPVIEVGTHRVFMQPVVVSGENWWVGVAKTREMGVRPEDLRSGRAIRLSRRDVRCRFLFTTK